ncbi:MAG: hypothetical protein RL684_220 [Pseudomonadota bacterium]|jgi:hypothetical protein
MNRTRIVLAALALAIPAWADSPSVTPGLPSYTPDGQLHRPDDYREWIYLTTGLDMSYSPSMGAMDHSRFDNVFVSPAAFHAFLKEGNWPDGTMLVLEVRNARGKGSINQHGQYQVGDAVALEVHVRDASRFEGGWAFFSFEGAPTAKRIPMSEDCYSCHRQHAAVDTTFVQFYPTLLGIAQMKKTLSAQYLREQAAR